MFLLSAPTLSLLVLWACNSSAMISMEATKRHGNDTKKQGRGLGDSADHCSRYLKPLIVASFTTSYKRLTSSKGESFLQHFVHDMLNIPNLIKIKGSEENHSHGYLFDRVYMHVPVAYSVRFGGYPVPVPKLPEWLDKLQNSSDSRSRFVVNRPAIDYGPSTKVLPVMLIPDAELPLCSIIVQVDEDELYDDINLNTLVATSLIQPSKLFGGLGWPVTNIVDDEFDWAAWERSTSDKNQQEAEKHLKRFLITKRTESEMPLSALATVESEKSADKVYDAVKVKRNDLLLGVKGIAYRKSHFLESQVTAQTAESSPFLTFALHSTFQRHCIYVDDIWLSGNMERLGREKYGITKFPSPGSGDVHIDPRLYLETDRANSKPKDKGPLDKLAYGLRNTDRLSHGPTQRFDNAFCALGLIDMYHLWGYPKSTNDDGDKQSQRKTAPSPNVQFRSSEIRGTGNASVDSAGIAGQGSEEKTSLAAADTSSSNLPRTVREVWIPDSVIYTERFKKFSLYMRKPFDPSAKPPPLPTPGDDKPNRVSKSAAGRPGVTKKPPRQSRQKSDSRSEGGNKIPEESSISSANADNAGNAGGRSRSSLRSAGSSPNSSARKSAEKEYISNSNSNEVVSDSAPNGMIRSRAPLAGAKKSVVGAGTITASGTMVGKRLPSPVKQQLVEPA